MARKKVDAVFPIEGITYAQKQKNLAVGAQQTVLCHTKTGTTYLRVNTVKTKDERMSNSASAIAHRQAFTNASQQLKTIMSDPAQKAPLALQFKENPGKYTTLRGFIFSKIYVKPE